MPDKQLQALLETAVVFGLPMTRAFRGITMREGVLIKGPSGWGEFAPFDDYTDVAAARWLDCAIESAFGAWPVSNLDEVAVNAIIPAVSSAEAAALTRSAVLDNGCQCVKVKVGGTLADDEARVAAVRDVLDAALGRGVGSIRIDANASWSVAEAVKALRRLGEYGLEYVEQPCADFEDIRQVRGQVNLPIALDEAIRGTAMPETLDLREVADFAIIKVAPLGGVAACLRLVEHLAMPIVISGSLDSSVGLGPSTALAGTLGTTSPCGLGTGTLLAADVVERSIVPVGGMIKVERLAPELGALMQASDRVSMERGIWWRARLAAAWHAGASKRAGSLIGSF
ncbi:MAG: o-succinylbenzoate synthase [Actinomycetota bacterium]|nr:o-succinylbenzoate synthase [Actinomycetota bacterium]